MKRRLFALAIALLLAVSLPVSALAATWYLENGDITIRATEDGQYVSQGDNAAVEDNTPVIKQNEQNDSSTATDKTSGPQECPIDNGTEPIAACTVAFGK